MASYCVNIYNFVQIMYHMLLVKFTELDQQLAYRFDLKERIQVIFHNQTLCNKIVLGRSVEC